MHHSFPVFYIQLYGAPLPHSLLLLSPVIIISFMSYISLGRTLYFDKDCLSIPLSDLKSPEFIKKRVNFVDWNKQDPPDSPKYKPFDIRTNQFGACFSRYYKVEIYDPHGEYYLLIPEYDIEAFNKLTQQSI